MYRYALRPRWILSHLFALFVVVLFVNLGLWQLRRHDERVARNAIVEARSELPPVPLDELLDDGADPEDLRFRQVTASGTWGDRDLLVDNRSKDGLPGAWVLRSLTLDDGTVVAVNRGFQGFDSGELDPPPVPAPAVALVGKATPWSGSCGSRTDDAGVPIGMACLDRATASAAFGADVAPVVVERSASEPPASAELSPVPLPELDAGPHRSYAGQWFIFATIVAVVYGLILRKVARERATPPGDHEVDPVGA